jgi:hypothetical protein
MTTETIRETRGYIFRLLIPLCLFCIISWVLCELSATSLEPNKMLNSHTILENLYQDIPIVNNRVQRVNNVVGNARDNTLIRCLTESEVTVLDSLSGGNRFDTVSVSVINIIKVSSDTVIAIVETVPNNYECHACNSFLSAALYTYHNNHWEHFLQNYFTTTGEYGYVLIKLVKLGRTHFGISLTKDYTGQGNTTTYTEIYALVNNKFDYVWGTELINDMSGVDAGAIDSTSYQFVEDSGKDWYAIRTCTQGTIDTSGVLESINDECLYIYYEGRFIPKDSLTLYTSIKHKHQFPHVRMVFLLSILVVVAIVLFTFIRNKTRF